MRYILEETRRIFVILQLSKATKRLRRAAQRDQIRQTRNNSNLIIKYMVWFLQVNGLMQLQGKDIFLAVVSEIT